MAATTKAPRSSDPSSEITAAPARSVTNIQGSSQTLDHTVRKVSNASQRQIEQMQGPVQREAPKNSFSSRACCLSANCLQACSGIFRRSNIVCCVGNFNAHSLDIETENFLSDSSHRPSLAQVDFEVVEGMSPKDFFLKISEIYEEPEVLEIKRKFLESPISAESFYRIADSENKYIDMHTDLMEILDTITRKSFSTALLPANIKKYFRNLNFFSMEPFTPSQRLMAVHFKEVLSLAYRSYMKTREALMLHQMNKLFTGSRSQSEPSTTGNSRESPTQNSDKSLPSAKESSTQAPLSDLAALKKSRKESSCMVHLSLLQETQESSEDLSERGLQKPEEERFYTPTSSESGQSNYEEAKSVLEAAVEVDVSSEMDRLAITPQEKQIDLGNGKCCIFSREKVAADLRRILILPRGMSLEPIVNEVFHRFPDKGSKQKVWDTMMQVVEHYKDHIKELPQATFQNVEKYVKEKLEESREEIVTIRQIDKPELAKIMSDQIRRFKERVKAGTA